MNWASRGKCSNSSRTRRARNSNQIEKKKKNSLHPWTLCRIVMFVIRTQSLVPCQMILQVELAITKKKKSTLLTTKNKFQINLQALEAEVAGEFFISFYSDY